jgi:histidinol-phosphate phosphatase family protein
MEEAKKQDLEKDVLKPLIVQGEVFGYRTPEYVKDAGTPARFYKASREQQEHVWARKNLEKKQACVFLDRDGTVNRYKGLIASEEQLELEDGAAEGIQKLNEAGFLVILVTNQPVVARGMCGIEDVKRIHRKLQVLLGEQGAYLDDITFCPHHPDKGYPEENPAYKIICKCRKPATGMIETMAEKYNIDLSKSYIAGDTSVDIQTGKNAGLKTILVLTGQAGEDGKYCMKPDITVKNLSEAAERILG